MLQQSTTAATRSRCIRQLVTFHTYESTALNEMLQVMTSCRTTSWLVRLSSRAIDLPPTFLLPHAKARERVLTLLLDPLSDPGNYACFTSTKQHRFPRLPT